MSTSKTSTTSFANKLVILNELVDSADDSVTEFVEYANIGIPLAYLHVLGYFDMTERIEKAIESAFRQFMAHCGIDDAGFTSLAEILPLIVPDPYFDLEPYVEED